MVPRWREVKELDCRSVPMTITNTVCTSCGHTTDQASPSPFCPQCGDEDPWDERAAHVFEEDDLPFVFSYEAYEDNYSLWGAFCEQYFGVYELKGTDIAGLPEEFPRLKYCVCELWFKITPSYELEGPFQSEAEARDA
jgi:hypothetical protein